VLNQNHQGIKLNFVVIDVETANADMASICAIGIAKYSEGNLVDEWYSLINPEDYFCSINVGIHGIQERDVKNAPKFPEVESILREYLSNTICVSHTHFDRVSIHKTIGKYKLQNLETNWLDSARVARRTWESCAYGGYGLSNLCKIIGYQFKHHNALEDAKAAGQIILNAINITGIDINGWLTRVEKPIFPTDSKYQQKEKRDGNPEGELFGNVLVFTGELQIPRSTAADIAAKMGCSVATSVTKKTTLLVVGDQDISKLVGKKKSAKHIKAEELIVAGQAIRILKESDFLELANQCQN
jgi:DNA polymerase III subunit epsilon